MDDPALADIDSARNWVVSIQAYVLEMLADDMRGSITLTGALTGGFQIIELLDKLAKALLKELFSRNPCVELVIQA